MTVMAELEPVEANVWRCRRGPLCAERDRGEDGEGNAVWSGALLSGDGLCGSCTRHVGYAIAQLPGDVTELSSAELLAPTGERHLADPRMPLPPRGKPGPETPLRDDVYSLVELIDAEVTMWATSVARSAGMDGSGSGEWLPINLRDMTRARRVEQCCQLLGHRLPYLLGLPSVEHPARSKTARRADGHDPDLTTRYGDEYWTNRDGVEGALLLLKLHRDAEHYTGRKPADRVPLPCPRCRRPALIRLHNQGDPGGGYVDCRACHHRMTDQEYDAHFYGLWQVHHLDDPPVRPEEPIVPPTPPPPGSYRVRPRRPAQVALDVTGDNLRDVAEWCGGELQSFTDEWKVTTRWVTVPGSTRNARPGDILLFDPGRDRNPDQWRVLDPEVTTAVFERVEAQ